MDFRYMNTFGHLFIVFLFVFLLVPAGFAATLYVNATLDTSCNAAAQPHTNDYGTIQEAHDAGASGDTIIVCRNGTGKHVNVADGIAVSKSINIYGNQTDTKINRTPAGEGDSLFTITARGVNISNFTFMDSTINQAHSILSNATEVNISNNNFINNNYAISFNTPSGSMSSGHYLIIENNNFSSMVIDIDNGVAPIAIHVAFANSSNPHKIYNNLFTGDAASPVADSRAIAASETGISSAQIANNTFINWTYGIFMEHTLYQGFNVSPFLDGRYVGPNIFINNSIGIGLFNVSLGTNVTIVNNTFANHSLDGVLKGAAIYLQGLNYTVIANNTFSGWDYNSIRLNVTYLTTVKNNLFTNNNGSILAVQTYNSSFDSNRIFNSSSYAFYINNSQNINFTENNVTNSTYASFHFINNANATFNGTNMILSNPQASLDFNVSNSTITTLAGSTYNIIETTYLHYFFNTANNVTVKSMNLSDSGVTTTGCDSFAGTCTLITNSTNVVNVTNSSLLAHIDLGIYYNLTHATLLNAHSADIHVASYNNTNQGWRKLGQSSIDTTFGNARFDYITTSVTTMSTFGVVHFLTAVAASSSSQGVAPLAIKPAQPGQADSGSVEIECPANRAHFSLQSGGSPIAGAHVRLILYEPYGGVVSELATDADGKVVFDLALQPAGTYQVEASKSGYQKPLDVFFEFAHCVPEEELPVEETPVQEDAGAGEVDTVPHEEPKEPQEGEPVEPTDAIYLETAAREELVETEILLNMAENQGKDTSRAQRSLDAARTAFKSGDYERARALAQEAAQLAQAAAVADTGKMAVKNNEQVEKETVVVSDTLGSALAGIAIIVAVVAIAAVFYFSRRK